MENSLHIYRCNNPRRTRRICPHHKRLEYGELQEFYDTRRIFFDCGTLADYGYGYYEPPKKYKRMKFYWDKELKLYVLYSQGWHKLFSHTNRNKILKVAYERLKNGGIIKDLDKGVKVNG